MWMVTVSIEDPDWQAVKTIGDEGRLYIGREYAGRRVHAYVEFVDMETDGDGGGAADVDSIEIPDAEEDTADE